MNWRNVFTYLVLVLGALVLFRIVMSAILGILGLIWAIITTVVAMLITGAVLYGGYKLFSWSRRDKLSLSSGSSMSTEPADRVDTLKEQYANGELSQAELEHQLERELGKPKRDSSEYNLHREYE